MATLTTQEFESFRDYIETECGISLGVDKIYLVESRLKPMLAKHHCVTYGALYQLTSGPDKAKLRQEVIDAITTNETLWFRDKAPFEVLAEVFLPQMKELIRKGKPKVRIWSAACSTGQEPYSIAMVIHDFIDAHGEGFLNPNHFEILATDISIQALAIARVGAYDKFTMGRGMDEAQTEKFFKQNQQFWIINPNLKKQIVFKEINLQEDFSALGAFDAIFIRNVAIYFAHDAKVRLFEKVQKLMVPHSILFLGSTESMSYYSNKLAGREHKKSVYYQLGFSPSGS
ncbi:MAG: protein-glutamate O-methyltransferase CheR [Deltaproteobacteria bacterium]|nr:protein-glutamate O-methyltransferase CheR [Deltaproteobacteria bacterium]